MTVTMTSTVPVPAGLVAVHCVGLAQLTFIAAFAPKAMAVAEVLKPVPEIVTLVPPLGGPLFGVSPETVGP